MSIGSKSLLGCGVAAACALTISAAQAAPEPFCRDYTRAALNQVHKALSLPRCRPGMEGARWSTEFKVHFDWCIGVTPSTAEAERIARTNHLRRCE